MALIREAVEACAPTPVSTGPRVQGIHGGSTGPGSRQLCYRRTISPEPLPPPGAVARSTCPWNAIGCVRWSPLTPGWIVEGRNDPETLDRRRYRAHCLAYHFGCRAVPHRSG